MVWMWAWAHWVDDGVGLECCSPDTSGPSSLLPTATGAQVSSCYHGPDSYILTFSAVIYTLSLSCEQNLTSPILNCYCQDICHNKIKGTTHQQQWSQDKITLELDMRKLWWLNPCASLTRVLKHLTKNYTSCVWKAVSACDSYMNR